MKIKSRLHNTMNLLNPIYILTMLILTISYPKPVFADPIYVAKGTVLWEEGGDRRRLIIEPGTILKYINKHESFEQGLLYEVQTPTGIKGAMRANDIEIFEKAPEGLAFVKKDFTRRGVIFSAGDLHPYNRIHEPDEVAFDVDKGVAKYVVSENDYKVKRIKIRLNREDFIDHMNVVTEKEIEQTSFPLWVQATHSGKKVLQTWGCGESSKVIDFLSASAIAEGEVSGSFWTWLRLKFSTNLKASSDHTWTIEKRDEEHQHKLTFWSLTDSRGDTLLRLVIDRIGKCPPSESNKINYVFSFPGNEIDSFEISHSWVKQNNFRYKGTVVPLTMVDIIDLEKLEDALLRSGYLKFDADLPYSEHVRDQIVRITAAVLTPKK